MEFKKYLEVERLGKEDVEGILFGECVIFSKIDGTNASVWLDKDGIIQCGSRNRQISLEKDNLGFCSYINKTLHPKIEKLLKVYPDYRLYGEYLKPHTLKDYRDSMWDKFWIFDVFKDDIPLHYKEYRFILQEYGLDYIVPYKTITNPSMEQLMTLMERNTRGMKPGTFGEGIVIKNLLYKNKFGRLVYGKIVRDEFKEANAKVFGPPKIKGPKQDEIEFTEKFIIRSRIDKLLAKLQELEYKAKIPRFLETLYHEVIEEELYGFVNRSNKILNFNLLRYLVFKKAKELTPELFGG